MFRTLIPRSRTLTCALRKARRGLLTKAYAVGPTEVCSSSSSQQLQWLMVTVASIAGADGPPALCGRGEATWRSKRVRSAHSLELVSYANTASRVISHHQQTILTYDTLDRDSNKLARGLQRLGVKKGDRVAVSLGNNIEFAIVCACTIAFHTKKLMCNQDYICFIQAGGHTCECLSSS